MSIVYNLWDPRKVYTSNTNESYAASSSQFSCWNSKMVFYCSQVLNMVLLLLSQKKWPCVNFFYPCLLQAEASKAKNAGKIFFACLYAYASLYE